VIAPPLYVAVTNTVDKNQGIHVLNEALKTVEDVIKSKQGTFIMKVQVNSLIFRIFFLKLQFFSAQCCWI